MFKASVTLDSDVFQAISETAQQARPRMRRAMGIVARGEVAQAMIRELSADADKPDYPIEWTSERQRRAFFATKGFGRGIPYRRDYRLEQGWRVVLNSLTDEAGVIGVENSVPYAIYVQGLRQQKYLKKHPSAARIIEAYRMPFNDLVIDAWLRVVGIRNGK